jgi:tRNA threonylcarbamoyladenosine biosynthesis protein TsaB
MWLMIARLHWPAWLPHRRRDGRGERVPPSAMPGPATDMTPTLLVFDTSTERLALGLHTAAGTWLVDEPGGTLASATLLPRIQAMLAEAGVAGPEVDAIAFGSGPGAFTGLRTSAAVAQGLALGWGKPVMAIDSLLIVADDARDQRCPAPVAADDRETPFDVAVLMDARMGQAYAGLYRWWRERWSVLLQPGLFDLPALADGWPGQVPSCIAGSALAAFGARLVLPQAPRVIAEGQRAAALLRLAQAGWLAGHAVDAALGLPLYVRDKVAQTTLEREAGR